MVSVTGTVQGRIQNPVKHKMKRFVKIVNGFTPKFFRKRLHLKCLTGSQHASAVNICQRLENVG